MTLRLALALSALTLVGCASIPPAHGQETPPTLAKMDALEIEKWGLEVRLAQTQLEVLQRAAANLQWEAGEIKRRLEAAGRARDETIARAAAAAKVDPRVYRPDVESLTWVKSAPGPPAPPGR